jgi:iron complex transport system permease protein
MRANSSHGLATPGRAAAFLALLAAVAMATIVVALAVGSVPVGPTSIARALIGSGVDSSAAVVRDLRLPRALAAFAVGGLLALAGALMQILLRNPLADPYVLGISGGAAVGALGAMFVGLAGLVAPAAFCGALASIALVFGLSRAGAERTPWTSTRLLLTGVVAAAGWGAHTLLSLPRMAVEGNAVLVDRDFPQQGRRAWHCDARTGSRWRAGVRVI